MDPVEYLRGLRRRWLVMLAAVAVGLSAAWLMTGRNAGDASHAEGYEASIVMLNGGGSQGAVSSRTTTFSTETLAFLATIEGVTERAASELDGDTEADELRSVVQASADEQTGIVTITATADRPGEAERIADAVGVGFQDYLRDTRNREIKAQLGPLRRQLKQVGGGSRSVDQGLRASLQSQISQLNGELSRPLGILILERTEAEEVNAAAIRAPSSRVVLVAIGGVVGLLGGIVLALILERLDRRIRSRRAFEEHFPFPLLAEIPVIGRPRRVEVAVRPLSMGADAFRILASAVLHAMKARFVRSEGNGHAALPPSVTIAVTSADRAEGKTLVVANLAGAFAELGLSVIAISCDLRRPTIHRFFDVPQEPGVVNALQTWEGRAGFQRIRHETTVPNVTIVPSGPASDRPAAVLAAEDMRDLLKIAAEEADIVILDTPALMLSGDAASLLARADGVLLVARVGKVTVDSAERMSETLDRLGSPVIGFALNGTSRQSIGWRNGSYPSTAPPASIGRPTSTPEAQSGAVVEEYVETMVGISPPRMSLRRALSSILGVVRAQYA
jgi:capsular exopolysaccharide synthesis family protein